MDLEATIIASGLDAKDDDNKSGDEYEYQTNWTQASTHALLDEYKNMKDYFGNPEHRLKDLWIVLAKNMRAKGFQVSSSICDRKFRNMKTTFRTICNSNRRKRTWEFYDKFSKLIETQNQSFARTQELVLHHTDTTQNYIQIGSEDEAEVIAKKPPVSKIRLLHPRRVQKISPPKWYSEFLQKYNKDQEYMRKSLRTIHIENKQMELRKIKLLENVISLLKDKKDN